MKTESKIHLLVWIVVFLAILNISTLATILFRQNRSEKRIEIMSSDSLRSARDNFSGRFFRDKLNLDAEQMEKFREINFAFREKAREITLELASIRRDMHIELTSLQSDTSKLNLLSDSVGILHRELKRLSFRYYLDIKEICTPEQRDKLEIIFREAFIDEMPMRGPGPRAHGRQLGRRKGNPD